jgi:hypothetical protein
VARRIASRVLRSGASAPPPLPENFDTVDERLLVPSVPRFCYRANSSKVSLAMGCSRGRSIVMLLAATLAAGPGSVGAQGVVGGLPKMAYRNTAPIHDGGRPQQIARCL